MGMYMPTNSSLGSLFSNLWGKVKNTFTPTQTAYPGANAANFQKFYQVKDDDTDMDTVAKNLGVNLPDLVAANNGIKTLPPKGSYIQTAPDQLVNQGVPPAVAERLGLGRPGQAELATQQYNQIMASQYGGGTASFVSGTGKMNLTELNTVVQNQVAQGEFPPVVSYYTPIINPATGQAVTDLEMQKNGYVYNNLNKQWELSGAAQQGQANPSTPKTGNNYQTNAALRSVSYKGKFTTNAKWAMNAYKRQKREEDEKKKGTQKRFNQESAGSVLNLKIGSG